MRKASVANAKAHFSEIVDRAEHKKQRTLILRHGKPAAVVVPVEVALSDKSGATRPMSAAESRALLDRLAANAPESTMTVEEALGRNRLDRF